MTDGGAVRLLPATAAWVAGDLSDLARGPGWPHADTLIGLRLSWRAFVAVLDGGRWAGCAVGDCGIKAAPDDAGVIEVGYGLAAPFHGRGLGTAMVAALLAECVAVPGARSVRVSVDPANEPSLRLAARLGFAADPAAPPDGQVWLVRPLAGAAPPAAG